MLAAVITAVLPYEILLALVGNIGNSGISIIWSLQALMGLFGFTI